MNLYGEPMTRPGLTSAAPSFGEIVGRNVRALREERGLTQHEFLTRCQTFGLRWPRKQAGPPGE